MENSSYALYIAVGTLIGIAVLSLVLFRWRQIGSYEKSKDEALEIKNKAAFNAEYEAYNKKLMYGTDVLSCLNKAQNNNQRYVYNNYYGTDSANIGKDDRVEFFIDVQVKISSTLCDNVKAYYKDKTGKYQRAVGLGTDSVTINNYLYKVFSNSNTGPNKFKDQDVYYYYFKDGLLYQKTGKYTDLMWSSNKKEYMLYNIIKEGKIQTKVTAGTYNLLAAKDKSSSATSTSAEITQTAQLSALITTSSLKDQELQKDPKPTILDKRDWCYCVWTTAASDFKSRKFKCTGVEYDSTTGYINKIKFEEVNK